MKTQIKKHTIIILLSLILILSIYIIPQVIAPAVTQQISISEKISTALTFPRSFTNKDNPFLLIILSPQYQQDTLIINEIINYQKTIYNQPGWSSKIHNLTFQTNTITHIDSLIDQYAKKYNLTSILLIGEDITLPKKTEYKNIIKPDIKPYSTITINNMSKQVCVSFLHPHPADSYQQKQFDLITTINRFSQKRILSLNSQSLIIEQKDLSIYSEDKYKQLINKYTASYQKELSPDNINTLFLEEFDLICFHGHGQPNQLMLNSTSNVKISSNFVSKINTKILSIDGCYTDSYFKDQDNSQMVFLTSVCKSDSIHIGFFGLLSQKTATDEQNVINSILTTMDNDSTIAETINDAQVGFDFVFSGDPSIKIIN